VHRDERENKEGGLSPLSRASGRMWTMPWVSSQQSFGPAEGPDWVGPWPAAATGLEPGLRRRKGQVAVRTNANSLRRTPGRFTAADPGAVADVDVKAEVSASAARSPQGPSINRLTGSCQRSSLQLMGKILNLAMHQLTFRSQRRAAIATTRSSRPTALTVRGRNENSAI